MHNSRSRILIADDHTLVADLCKRLLQAQFDVLGIVNDGRALVRAAAELKPDVIVVDIGMSILNGLDASRQVKKILPAVRLVFLTMNTDAALAAEAFRRGASGYLLKTCAAAELMTAICEVLKGRLYMSRTLPKNMVNDLWRLEKEMSDEEAPLTERQCEVLQLLAELSKAFTLKFPVRGR